MRMVELLAIHAFQRTIGPMQFLDEPQLCRVTAQLSDWAAEYDRTGQWPERSVELLADCGAWRWNVPAEFGGRPVRHGELLRIYEAISAGCMSTSLIVTQRDGAVELIATSPNDAVKRRWLPALARGEIYTTVGISHLTTSQRSSGAMMTAEPDGDGYRMTGMMPWATGAERAAIIVTGATLPDGQQILACVPMDRAGIKVDEPDDLFVLNASRTSCVHCEDYRVDADEILRGPAERVLSIRTPVKPLVTSACGVGVARALHDAIFALPAKALETFEAITEPLHARYETVRSMLYKAADHLDDPEYEVASSDIRVLVNEILMRLAVASLTLAKGSAFLTRKPVQRQVREALFFLVWSATPSTRLDTLLRLMGPLSEPRL